MISGHAISTLLIFIFSAFFVIHPVSIPTPRPLPRIPINLTTAPILAISLLWAAQCIDLTIIRNGIVGTEGVKPYSILILFFSLAYMAITLDVTGILQAMAFWVSNKSGYNGWKLYLYFYVMFTLASILIGNDPVVLSGAAFLVCYTRIAKLDPQAWIMAEFAAANAASMVLFTANPTNVVICEAFNVNNAAFTAYTILPFLVGNLFSFAVLGFQFRKQVPRSLAVVPYRDPRTALRDPVGAWVGSVMLSATLIPCLIVGHFGIDVWMISLPLAFAKFMFDLGLDYYRYSRNLMTVDEAHDEAMGAGQHIRGRSYSRSSFPMPIGTELSQSTVFGSRLDSPKANEAPVPQAGINTPHIFERCRSGLAKHFPTVITALPRLPFAPVLFAFSQFILIEALDHQGWVHFFGDWFIRASHKEVQPTIWLIGVLGVMLCNVSGTNIGATLLLTKVVRAAALPHDANRAAAIALAVASNIGAVNVTFSASLAGLRWRAILEQQGVHIRQREFAFWNLLPLLAMTIAGLGIVSAEMAVLFQPHS